MIHRIQLPILLLFLSLFVFRGILFPQEKLVIDSVRFIINKIYIFDWTNQNILPAPIPGCGTEPYTITTLMSFYPGQTFIESRLRREVSRSISRLLATKYFDSAEGYLKPVDGKPGSYRVVIEMTEAGQFRFGGGFAYGTLKILKLAGKPYDLKLNLGYNLIGLELRMKYLAFEPIHLIFNSYYRNNGIFPNSIADYHLYSTSIKAGIEFPIDWIAGIDIELKKVILTSLHVPPEFAGLMENWQFILSPSITFSFNDGKDPIRFASFFSIKAKFYAPLDKPDWISSLQVVVALKRPLKGWKHSLNFQFSAGTASALLPLMEKFNIKGTTDMAVRSPQDYSKVLAENYALLNIEYRFRIIHFFLPPVFDTSIDAYLFADFGVTSPFGKSLFETDYLSDAYGFGLRATLDNPLAVSGSLSFGFNRFGEFRIIAWGTSGF